MISFKNFLIGASVAASFSAIATTPVRAAALTLAPNSIQFNTTNYRTYTGGSAGTFTPNNLAAARTALTDSDLTSNVELWYTTENPTANEGFTGKFVSQTLGTHAVSVSSVTAADWAIFGDNWLNGLLAANSEINTIWNKLSAPNKAITGNVLKTFGLFNSGDPNIGALTLDEATGKIDLALVGHDDLKPRINQYINQYTTGNKFLDSILRGAFSKITGKIQASEIAKLTVDGQTSYAYSFSADASGITTPDGTESYTGIYHYSPQLTIKPPTKPVPEPSAILGLLGAGTLFAAKRKMMKKA